MKLLLTLLILVLGINLVYSQNEKKLTDVEKLTRKNIELVFENQMYRSQVDELKNKIQTNKEYYEEKLRSNQLKFEISQIKKKLKKMNLFLLLIFFFNY